MMGSDNDHDMINTIADAFPQGSRFSCVQHFQNQHELLFQGQGDTSRGEPLSTASLDTIVVWLLLMIAVAFYVDMQQAKSLAAETTYSCTVFFKHT